MRTLTDRRTVLFDAGGTLITLDYDRIRQALAPLAPGDDALEHAEALARRWADNAVREHLLPRELWDGYFTRVLARVGVPESSLPRVLQELWETNRKLGLWRRPVACAKGVLEQLRRGGKRIAVVSNAEGQVEADLVEAGFGEYLETVVDSHLVGVAKPDPRIFEICLERLGTVPEDCVYVGDVPAFDVEGARAAGIPCILLDPHGVHAALDGVIRIRTLDELPALLLPS